MSSPQPSSGEQHQAQQAALAAAMVPLIAQAWLLVDVKDLAGTLPKFKQAVTAIVQHYGRAASVAAIDYYRRERLKAGVTGIHRIKPTPGPPLEQVASVIDWAVKDLWRPAPEPATTADLTPPAEPVKPSITVTGEFVPDEKLAQERLAVAADKLVMDQGRDTIINEVKSDPEAKGWARVPHPDQSLTGTCAFCLMLASRGAMYKTKASAKFQAHDRCHCTPEPQFSNHYEPTATVRAAQKLWEDSTKGLSGREARLAFRRAVEGRTASGKGGSAHPVAPIAPEPVKVSPEKAAQIIAALEKSLAKSRANNTNGQMSKSIAVTEQRIEQLKHHLLVAA
jgi:hypothetical protein